MQMVWNAAGKQKDTSVESVYSWPGENKMSLGRCSVDKQAET